MLEATIRTIYDYPIKKQGNSKGLVQKNLKGKFQGEYLSNEWRKPCDQAILAFYRLRDRNAHPDWLTGIEGAISSEERAQALDDMIYLCRFYGYVILALSGVRGLKPNFPESHRDWQPAAIITPLGESEPEGQTSLSRLQDLNSPFADLPQNSSRHAKMMALRRFYKSRSQ